MTKRRARRSGRINVDGATKRSGSASLLSMRHRARTTFAIAAALAAIPGCSRDTEPRAPDASAPDVSDQERQPVRVQLRVDVAAPDGLTAEVATSRAATVSLELSRAGHGG